MAKDKASKVAARARYKAGILEFLACVKAEAATGEGAIQFWRDELEPILARHLKVLAPVALPEVRTATKAEDRTDPAYRALAALTAERDAAVARAEAVGARFRAGRREDGEGWERLQAAERTIADLRAQLAAVTGPCDLAAPDLDDAEFWAGRAEAAVASLDGTELDVPMWAEVA